MDLESQPHLLGLGIQAYAAGFLEGCATHGLIWDFWVNEEVNRPPDSPDIYDNDTMAFINENDDWLEARVRFPFSSPPPPPSPATANADVGPCRSPRTWRYAPGPESVPNAYPPRHPSQSSAIRTQAIATRATTMWAITMYTP